MSDPHLRWQWYSQPDTYHEYGFWYYGTDVLQYKYTNMGVPNHWFYLLANGGTHNGVTITGIGMYAADEYSICSENYIQTINAWNAVQVPSDNDPQFDIVNPCAEITAKHTQGLPYSGTASHSFSINCQLSDNRSTTIKSGGTISLTPGYKSGTGGYFLATIVPCAVEGGLKSELLPNIDLNDNPHSSLRQSVEVLDTKKINLYPNVNIESFPEGIYFVRLISDDFHHIEKIIKK